MPSNTPRAQKAHQRDAARQKALQLRAQQEKAVKRNRIIAISGLVAAMAVLVVVVITILGQSKPVTPALDAKHPLAGVTAPTSALANGGLPVGTDGTVGSTSPSGAADVAVYYDYQCPFCANFEKANGATLDKMMAAGKEYEPHVYSGAPHAFFNDTRPSFTVGAARDAWARLLTFFAGLPAL